MVDVLVIGAGPAGLSAGIVFARHGLRTLVCDKRELPHDKACGEGIMPVGVTHLRRLGVTNYLLPHDYYPFLGIRYFSQQGACATGSFHEGPGWGILRLRLLSALLSRARQLPDLEIRTGVHVKYGGKAGNYPCIQVDEDQILARLVVGADGIHSRVRRWAGLQGQPPSIYRWGVRQHFAISPWSEYVEVHWEHGLEAYLTPCGQNLVGVTFLWDRNVWSKIPGGPEIFPFFLNKFPRLEQYLAGAAPVDRPRAIGPLQASARSVIHAGVLLIGDASGYLDALTGEGISLALAQALALEETVVPLLLGNTNHPEPLSVHDLSAYANAHRAIVTPYFRLTGLLLQLQRRPGLARRVIKALSRQPDLFQHLLSANMGLASPWPGFRKSLQLALNLLHS